MKVEENYDLCRLNTFGVPAQARFFAELRQKKDLVELLASSEFKNHQKFFLGSGSNILFTKDFDGLVVLNKLKGIEILEDSFENVIIKAMAGEIWHDLVLFAVQRGFWGIENLALIPGTVGAAPIQNVGAYGAELKDVLENVETYEVESGAKRIFSKEECEFGYRDSVFKNRLKGKYFIFAVTLKLSKLEKKNIGYKILQKYLKEHNIIGPKASPVGLRPRDVSDAVSEIRRSKLPDPAVIGNAGSFFKNVFMSKENANKFLAIYPNAPHFEEDGMIKVPSAWLIEQCGWKGKKLGRAGVHEKQALVLVNYGGASGAEIKNLAEQIVSSVFSKFGLRLIQEVNLI